MYRVAFKMQLFPGFEEEYQKRHDALWPELQQLLKSSGIHDYSIFLDESTHSLFAILRAEDPAKLTEMRLNPIMKKWWNYMKDIMASNEDASPVSVPLKEMFYLP